MWYWLWEACKWPTVIWPTPDWMSVIASQFCVGEMQQKSQLHAISSSSWGKAYSIWPKPPTIAIVCQIGLSTTSCRASVTVTPVSQQIWWIQVVCGRQQACLHSCDALSLSLALVQIRRIWLAGAVCGSLATAQIIAITAYLSFYFV